MVKKLVAGAAIKRSWMGTISMFSSFTNYIQIIATTRQILYGWIKWTSINPIGWKMI